MLPAIQNGEEAAFTKLYTLFYARLYHFSFSILRISDTSNEVVEDVFMNLWRNRSRITDVQNIAVYLYVAVKNRSLSRLTIGAKKWKTSGLENLDISLMVDNDPYSSFITNEMLGKVNEAIGKLPPRCRMIFKLIREDGLRYKEVAEILNISVNTIDVQMATAVKRISEALGVTKNIPQTRSVKKAKKNTG